MPFVMNLSCVNMKMTLNEALVAATLNSAGKRIILPKASMNRSKTNGSLEKGKFGDCIIINDENWKKIIYELIDPPIYCVIKKGKIAYKNDLFE